MTCENACGGRCCVAFCLPLTRAQLQRKAAETQDRDTAFIADMVIPLRVAEARERAAAFDLETTPKGHAGHWFTCRHWDEDTGICTVYEERPRMCSDYPYGGECRHCGFKG